MIVILAALSIGGFVAYWIGFRVGWKQGWRQASGLTNQWWSRKTNESPWPTRSDSSGS